MQIETRRYTVAEYEAFADAAENSDRRFELIDGEIVEMSPTGLHAAVQVNISTSLHNFVKPLQLGRVFTEARHQLLTDNHNAYVPDVSFILKGRLGEITDAKFTLMPDLAVEVRSFSDSLNEMRDKARYYLANGTTLVWVIVPQKRLIEVYEKGKDVVLLLESEGDTLDGGDLLPGFTMSMRDVFDLM